MQSRKLNQYLLSCAALALALPLGACGGGGGSVNSTPTPTPAPTPTPTPAPTPTPTTTDYNTPEYRFSNGASSASAITAYQAGATGEGITAAVIDSGINPSLSEFTGKTLSGSTDTAGTRGLGDDDGHGTAVAAVIAAAKNDRGIQGVAFNAKLLIARTDSPGSCANTSGPVEDQGCQHSDSDIARGVDLAVANNARVINISLGGSAANSTLMSAISRATAVGVIIVISAGNDSDPNPDPLAAIALNSAVSRGLVIIAGAVDANNTIADFSNQAGTGASQYLSALGVSVHTVDNTGATVAYSGTSFSAPIISGAVALLAQAFPNLTGAQIVKLLFDSARDIGATGDDTIYGQGLLDLSRAFQPQGSLALAGSGIAITDGSNGTTSAPMGDGGTQTGQMNAVILDGYGRAYALDLARTVHATAPSFTLGVALQQRGRQLAAASPATAISVSVADNGHGAGITPLLLDPRDARMARATAGYVASRIDPRTQIALGLSTGAATLSTQLKGEESLPFLVAENPRINAGFTQQARTSFALRHEIGGFGITATAENGDALLYDGDGLNALRNRYSHYGYDRLSLAIDRQAGPVSLALEASRLDEGNSVLGAHFGPALGGNGATSWFLDFAARWDAGHGWSASGTMRQGITNAAAGGMMRQGGQLRTNAFAFDIAKTGAFSAHDRFALRFAQPLRVASGGFDLRLPIAYDYETLATTYGIQRLNLAPTGRELDAEAAYARPLWRGWMTANLYYRRQPGNLVYAPDDVGAAIRFSMGF